jgi:tetratricopeptide (TPR) repeat protein
LLDGRLGQLIAIVAIVAVATVARADNDADALYERARVADQRAFDPAGALALYDRIAREFPDARVALAARRRADQLRALVGSNGEHAREAAELMRLVAESDRVARADVERRADALADAAWPGAPEAASWLAAWLRERGDYAAARARFERVAERWPSSPHGPAALRGAAGCALDAGDWAGAEAIAARLPESERDARDEIEAAAALGRRRDRVDVLAWLVLAVVIAALAGSLAEAIVRDPVAHDRSIASSAGEAGVRGGGARVRLRAALHPPIEVAFLAPVAAVLVAIGYAAQRTIAPAVLRISLAGVAFAWLSGATLDALRARGRPVRVRAVLHVVACALGVVAVGYLATTRDGLYDMLVETARFGPEP